jgi:hypothetical protein
MDLYKFHNKPDELVGVKYKHLLVNAGAHHYVSQHDSSDPDFNIALKIVSKNAAQSYRYAVDIIKKPFPLGEDAISKSDAYSMRYAIHVLKPAHERGELKSARFIKGEPAIIKNAELAKDYAEYIIKGPFPEAESVIAKDPGISYYYVSYVLKKPFPEGEQAIFSNPYYREKYFTLLKVWGFGDEAEKRFEHE